MTALAGDASVMVRMSAKVSLMECSRCTPSPVPSVPGPRRPLIGGIIGTAPVPMISLS
jgi:hypothetical protein